MAKEIKDCGGIKTIKPVPPKKEDTKSKKTDSKKSPKKK